MPPTPRQRPADQQPEIADASLDAAFGPEPADDEPIVPLAALVNAKQATSAHNVHTALTAFQREWPKIGASETARVNPKDGSQGYIYKYAGLDIVAGVVTPLLAKFGLAFTSQPTIGAEGRGLVLRYQLVHGASGTQIEGELPLTAGPANPQALGSQITYFRRYALLAVTNTFPGGEDDDGAAAKADDERRRMNRQRAEEQNRREQPALVRSVERAQQRQQGGERPPLRSVPAPVADVDTAGYPGADEAGEQMDLGSLAHLIYGNPDDPTRLIATAITEYAKLSDEERTVTIGPADVDGEAPHLVERTPGGLFEDRVNRAIDAAKIVDTLTNIYRALNAAELGIPFAERMTQRRAQLEAGK